MNSTTPNRRLATVQKAMRRVVSTLPLAVLAVPLACAACGPLGYAAYALSGSQHIDPKYVLPKDPTLVFVENFRLSAVAALDAEQLGRQIDDQLTQHKIVPIIEPEKLYDLKHRDSDAYRKMSIVQIGSQLGATQIIYVDLQSSDVEQQAGSDMAKGMMSVRVRVINVGTGLTVWPKESEAGYPIAFQTPSSRLGDGVEPEKVREATFVGAADQIAKLFYKWETDD